MTVLYHYCSTSSFADIVSSQSICLSLLTLSNDTMEGRLVAETIEQLVARDRLDEATIEDLKSAVRFLENLVDGLGFCLSEEGDLLSQWRGYADNARGFSVGFSKQYLLSLAESLKGKKEAGFTLHKVEYDSAEQKKLVRPTYQKVKEIIDNKRQAIDSTRGEGQLIRLDINRLRNPHNRVSNKAIENEIEKEKATELIKNEVFYKSIFMTMSNLYSKLYALKTVRFVRSVNGD